VSGFLQELIVIGVMGCTLMSGTVLIAMSLSGFSVREAVAWSQVPRCIPTLLTLRQRESPRFTVPAWMQYLSLAINVLVALSCFTDVAHANWSNAVLTVFVAFMTVNCT